jgi:hypothetical protein
MARVGNDTGVRFLEGSAVLDAIRQHSVGKRITAAVAYVGNGAADLLPLKAGDVVVVNGSRNALANGATSARLLRTWYENDVQVYVHETLHAKVFIVGRTAFVGSANLSGRAALADTAEAAIQTTDPAVVIQARDFVRRLAHDAAEVDEEWLDWADAVPVRADGAVMWNPDPPFVPNEPYDMWIGPEDKVDWSDEERALAARGRRLNRATDGRYGILATGEDRDDKVRLQQPDMVVLIRPRSAQLARFLERRTSARAAMGLYRTDRDAVRVSPSEIADALGLSTRSLREGWIRADGDQRAILIDLFDLPDHPPRRR